MNLCENDRLPVLRGHNRWVLARTDRDGADPEDVRETAGAFMSKALSSAQPLAQRSLLEFLSPPWQDATRFVVGAARPVIVQAHQPKSVDESLRLSTPSGRLLGVYTACPTMRTVEAQVPWLVFVDFDWRAPDAVIPWPRRKVNAIGIPQDVDLELDWLLLAAAFEGEAKFDDTSHSELWKPNFGAVVPWLFVGGVVVGGLSVVYFSKRKRAA